MCCLSELSILNVRKWICIHVLIFMCALVYCMGEKPVIVLWEQFYSFVILMPLSKVVWPEALCVSVLFVHASVRASPKALITWYLENYFRDFHQTRVDDDFDEFLNGIGMNASHFWVRRSSFPAFYQSRHKYSTSRNELSVSSWYVHCFTHLLQDGAH